VNRASQTAFQEYVIAVEETEMAIRRLEQEIHEIATHSSYAPMMQALQALRGFKEIAAATVVAEIGDFTRFAHPQQLMSYAGLVPRESSSGNKCIFRPKSSTDSGANRPPIPIELIH